MGTGLVIVWFLAIGLSSGPTQHNTHFISSQASGAAASSSSAAQTGVDPAKKAAILQLLDLTGAKLVMKQTMDQMSDTIKPVITNALPPGEYRAKLVDLFFEKFQSKANLDEMLDMAVPIYDKYFSADEIKGLIAFYQTPLGQKSISALPKLMGELGDAGKQWGENLGRQCMEEVLAEHPDLKQQLEEAGKNPQ